MSASKEHSYLGPRQVRRLVMGEKDVERYQGLARLGINIGTPSMLRKMAAWAQDGSEAAGMDGLEPLLTSPSLGAPLQFLQTWLPGFARVITAGRKIDELIGVTTAGSWEDEEIVAGVLEPVGAAALYGDLTNIPLSSWNAEWNRRTVIRFEQGLRVGVLEEARAAKARINSGAEKRTAAALSLDISRNLVGFYGFNGGQNRTYGFLNDPSLPAYVTAAAGASSSTLWSSKTFLEITADIRGMIGRLMAQLQDTVDLKKAPITLALPTGSDLYLTVTSDYGVSVDSWIKDTYPNIRVVTAPELLAANGGANVAYMYPESVADSGTDDGRVWTQVVPARFQTLGVEKQAKAYVEDYTNATAGVMVKRPYAITRLTGI